MPMRSARTGSVLLEFILVLPVYFVFIGGTFAVGEILVRALHVTWAERAVATNYGSDFVDATKASVQARLFPFDAYEYDDEDGLTHFADRCTFEGNALRAEEGYRGAWTWQTAVKATDEHNRTPWTRGWLFSAANWLDAMTESENASKKSKDVIGKTAKEIGKLLLKETQAYAETSMCRRKALLHYFGEDYKDDECGCCDNCRKPKKRIDAKELLCAVIETVQALKEKFKQEYVITVLEGIRTDEVAGYQHDQLECFGMGNDETPAIWNAVIRQALVDKYLSKDIESYGLLKVTASGKRFLNNPKAFSIVVECEDDDDMEETEVKGAGASAAADEALYNMLKDLRKKVAKRLELPPYVIFQDPSLEAMATTYPITIEELQNIPGVGAGKAKRYGEEFCALIKRHCDENEIVRPEDLRFRTVANKSKKKLDIIKAIDRKIALDELAQGQHLEFNELLDDLEAIIMSGTRINIDYFLREVMDPEDIDELYQYFKDSPKDDLEAAIQEYGDVFSEEEIRLIRIKFIAEMAN